MAFPIYRKLVATSVVLSGFGFQNGAQAQVQNQPIPNQLAQNQPLPNQPLNRETFKKVAPELREQLLFQTPVIAEAIKAANLPIPTGAKGRLVRIKNVRASLMAYWLDPAHNAEPKELAVSRRAQEKIFPQLTGIASLQARPLGDKLALPEGVALTPLDPYNFLYVVATDDGLAELRRVIDVLDKPLKQLEIETQYIQISQQDMKRLEITPVEAANRPDVKTSGPFKLGFAKFNVNAKLAELVKEQKVKILTAPRVTVIDGLTAEIRSTNSMPASLNYKDSTLTFITDPNFIAPVAAAPHPFYVAVGIGFAVRPKFNEDNSISLYIAPGRTVELQQGNKENPQAPDTLILDNLDGVQSIENLEDGESIALMGGTTSLVSNLADTKAKPENLLILVTPRIIRRVGDND